MRRHFPRTLVLLFATVALAACGGGSSGSAPPPPPPPTPFVYSVPADVGDGWDVAHLEDEGFETQMIVDMMEDILDGSSPGIDSVAIVRNGRLVHYWYDRNRAIDQFDNWIGNTDNERHVLHSTSKSFTSALIGIAIDQGHIDSTQVAFLDLFPYETYDNWDPRKADMTLEDALTMRLGIEWDEWSLPYTNGNNDLVRLNSNNSDWAKALLDLPLDSTPGILFAYNTAATNAIGQALENATGEPMAQYANTHLFYPMQITDAEWATTPTGLPVGGSGLYLKTRDLAKFGQLYLDGGMWQGQQLVSAAWVAASVVPHVDVRPFVASSYGYGYQWWLDSLSYGTQPMEVWVTAGYGGQYSFIVPGLELVVAFTGHNYENGAGVANLYDILQWQIMDAIN